MSRQSIKRKKDTFCQLDTNHYTKKINMSTKKITIPKICSLTPCRYGPRILTVPKARFDAVDLSNIVFIKLHFQTSVVIFDSFFVGGF